MFELLIGKNIILRKAVLSDLDNIYNNVWSDDNLFTYMFVQYSKTKEEAEERLIKTITYQKNNYAYFICLRDTDEVIGFCGLKKENNNQYRETGICISTKYQNLGFGKQVLKLLLDLVFINLKGQEFIYCADKRNIKSQKLCLNYSFELFDKQIIDDKEILFYRLNRLKYLNNKKKSYKTKCLTGEDVDLINEKKGIKHRNICDNHWDGA